jgi:hypothetical protein
MGNHPHREDSQARDEVSVVGLPSRPTPDDGIVGLGEAEDVSSASSGSTFWSERGISEEVAQARGYVWYTADDVTAVQAAYADLPQAALKATMTRRAKSREGRNGKREIVPIDGGLLIVRHVPPGLGLPPVFAEMRPDEAIKTTRRFHAHPDVRSVEILHPNGGRLGRRDIFDPTTEAMRRHIENEHGGVNVQVGHWYQQWAKYLFPPTPKVWVEYAHDHDEDFGDNELERAWHIRRRHHDCAVVGRHTHARKIKDSNENYAKRIDVNPLGVDLFADADHVFFAIEGCIKSDAILTAILKTGRKASVFSVPSVTLWDAPELLTFALKYLVGKTVYIVPDADWRAEKNRGAVISQSLLCRSLLRNKCGLDAHIAAPPGDGLPEIKGVDDFLAAGGELDDLIVIDRRVGRLRRTNDGRALKRNDEILEALSLHADEAGIFSPTLKKLARVIGTSPKRVERSVLALERHGYVSVVAGSLMLERNWYVEGYEAFNFAEKPTIEIMPELRAETTATRLGDHAGQRDADDWYHELPPPNDLHRMIRQLAQWNPKTTQQELADSLGVNQSTVSRALCTSDAIEGDDVNAQQLDRIEAKVDEIREWFPTPTAEAERYTASPEINEGERLLEESDEGK